MALPVVQPSGGTPTAKDFVSLQTQWARQINPVIGKPWNDGMILPKVALTAGLNTINHMLARPLQGWIIVRQRAASTIYDKQDVNPQPGLTLMIQSSAPVVVDLLVW